jgi:hypothetical protein
VQRCLQGGDAVTGVSVVRTVLKCDAGPVLAQEAVQACAAGWGQGEARVAVRGVENAEKQQPAAAVQLLRPLWYPGWLLRSAVRLLRVGLGPRPALPCPGAVLL